MKKTSVVVILIALVATATFLPQSAESAGRVSPDLLRMLDSSHAVPPDSSVSVVIFLQPVSEKEAPCFSSTGLPMRRSARIKSVISRLQSRQAPGQAQMGTFLENRSAHPVRAFWIVPAFAARIPVALIDSVSRLEGVTEIVSDVALLLESPKEISPAPSLSTSVSTELQMLSVPQLWSRGLTGAGRLVCSFDTGVEWDHPALEGNWRGNHASLSECWFSNIAPDSLPRDVSGHGTHTMGIMVGSNQGDTIGVAFDAEWITAGVIDQGGSLSSTISDILAAFEWVLNPDGDTSTTDDVPDVILNSWGIPRGLFSPCGGTFWGAIDNVEAAGIVTIFSAGNEGPDGASMRSPSDRASTPINSFAVGAVDDDGIIAGFSSRGPSTCNGAIKPEIVAPGVTVRSSFKGGIYTYMSGTSMAAPYIAGLAVLGRQYNPDVTVAEIKYALIQAATDLGPQGEDNAYGHGLPDAEEFLGLLPIPLTSDFRVTGYEVSDDGVAVPGEETGLAVFLTHPDAGATTVLGTIAAVGGGVEVIEDQSTFLFAPGQDTVRNFTPFVIQVDSQSYHGQTASMRLYLTTSQGAPYDSLDFSITLGLAAPGSIASHQTARLQLSVSDFGQLGFGPGSIYHAGGDGFCFDGSGNLLYEAGILLANGAGETVRAVRDSLGQFVPSGFCPVESLSELLMTSDGSNYRTARFGPHGSNSAFPVTVSQRTVSYGADGDAAFVIISCHVLNESDQPLNDLYLGLLTDFDLTAGDDRVGFDSFLNTIHQSGNTGRRVALTGLRNVTAFKMLENVDGKDGLPDSLLCRLLGEGGIDTFPAAGGDFMFLVGSDAVTLDPGDSIEVAIALIGANEPDELFRSIMAAKHRYENGTGFTDPVWGLLPGGFDLHPNYPNPFNPTTTISFTLASAGRAVLEVYNIIGQKVACLHDGFLQKGIHKFQWDGTSHRGSPVASGVYLYRLMMPDGRSQTRKMVLLK